MGVCVYCMADLGCTGALKRSTNLSIFLNLLFSGMRKIFILFGSFILLAACNSSTSNAPIETTSEGEINISVEESFKTIIEEELKVFNSLFLDFKRGIQFENNSLANFTTNNTVKFKNNIMSM